MLLLLLLLLLLLPQVPQQYPPETLAMYEGKRVEWARPPLRDAPPS